MSGTHEIAQPQAHLNNGQAEIERLHDLLRNANEECQSLRQALADTKAERDGYRELFLEQARAAREFEDLDIDTLKALSAGPLKPIA